MNLRNIMTRDIPNEKHQFLKQDNLQQIMIREPFLFEEWKQICTFMSNVKEHYWISNHGRLLSTFTIPFKILATGRNRRGYEITSLTTIDGNRFSTTIHRLVMIAFNPIENYHQYTVNHMDTNKVDNYLYNLEWLSNYDNMQHALKYSLFPCGEKHDWSVLTNNDVKRICEYIQQGIPFDEIMRNIENINKLKNPISCLHSIYRRDSWKAISKDYKFALYKDNSVMYTRDEAKTICEYLECNLGYKEILSLMGYNVDNMTHHEARVYTQGISRIRLGKAYSDISKNYSFGKDRSYQKFSEQQIHEICSYFEKGLSYDEILDIFNIDLSTLEKKPADNIRSVLYRIRNKRCFQNISKNYNF